MRCSILAPYAARFQDIDIELGGHKVPAGVSILKQPIQTTLTSYSAIFQDIDVELGDEKSEYKLYLI